MALGIEISGIRLGNPTVLASGILGTSRKMLERVIENGAGAVTTKSISLERRDGHNNPTVIEFDAGLMNAVGYSNPGAIDAASEFSDMQKLDAPAFVSIIGKEPGDFAKVAKMMENKGFSAIEIPLSCPHTPGFGTLAGQDTPEKTYEITKAVVKSTNLPVFVKISPNIKNIGDVAQAAERAGASAITAVNTMGPGMIINIDARKPVLDFKVGGVSGPALKPVAVRCVYDVYESVKIPIIGTGGIMSGKDAIEMIMAGAACVGIGSAVYYRGIDVFGKITAEIEKWMDKNGYNNIREMIGAAHE
ncbi:MAG: dihydroorotate dehydrogenase [Candidatus Micrarchaeota archaeon]|nr:dihydroorotate dehydrogenase [Candidatus Micrarchaeota archaeon]